MSCASPCRSAAASELGLTALPLISRAVAETLADFPDPTPPVTKVLRAGVIGPSGTGRVHIDAVRRIGAHVVAVAASSEARSRELADELHVPVGCADVAELVGRDDVDVVQVLTPNALHAEQARLALAAGRHVICEKPLAPSAAKAADLLRAAEASQLAARPHSTGQALSLADVGVQWWDLVEHVSGQRIGSVLCSRQAVRADHAIGEDSAAVMMRLDGGVTALAAISGAAPGHANTIQLELIGTEASMWWEQEDADRLWFGRLGSCRTNDAPEATEGGRAPPHAADAGGSCSRLPRRLPRPDRDNL